MTSDYLYKDSKFGEIEVYFYENEEMIHDVEIYLAGVQIAELPLNTLRKVESELSTLQDIIKGHKLERGQLLKEIKSNSSYRNVELELENKKLREALEFYANDGHIREYSYGKMVWLESEECEEGEDEKILPNRAGIVLASLNETR